MASLEVWLPRNIERGSCRMRSKWGCRRYGGIAYIVNMKETVGFCYMITAVSMGSCMFCTKGNRFTNSRAYSIAYI